MMIMYKKQWDKILYILLCIIAVNNSSFGQESTRVALEGTVGKASVVMEMTMNGTEVYGQYFYKRFKKSIPLTGSVIANGAIELVYEHWDEKEVFTIRDIGSSDMLYSGTWKNAVSETSLPVKLKPLNVSKIPVRNSYVSRTNLSEYDYARLADVSIKQDSVQILNAECAVTWLHDTITRSQSFRINKNSSLKGIDSINYFLEQLQYAELLSSLDCLGDYESGINTVYVRDHLLSFYLSNGYDCGGAHPDFGIAGYTFNLETGKQLELTDLLYFGKTKSDYLPGDDYKLGSEVMGPNIVKLLTKLYPSDMKGATEENGDCDYSSPDSWSYPAWYLTKEGLYLYPYFYRAARNCDGAEFSTIPYNVLVKYKNPRMAVPMKY